jgi:hypothetical protein
LGCTPVATVGTGGEDTGATVGKMRVTIGITQAAIGKTLGATVGTARGELGGTVVGGTLGVLDGATQQHTGKVAQQRLTHSPKFESLTKRSLEVTLLATPRRAPPGATGSATSGSLICCLPPSHA